MVTAIIRPACLDDAETLHRNCYPEANLEDVRDYLAWCLRLAEKGRIVRLVAEVNGQAVGNVQLTVWGLEGEVGSLVVAEAFRRQGLARQLVQNLVAEARKRDLVALQIGVSEHQPAILAFYQRLGFCQGKDTQKELSYSPSPGSVVTLRMTL